MQVEDGDPFVGLGGSTELRSLSEGATYEAWVAAHSAAGEGEPSPPQPATTTSRGLLIKLKNNQFFSKMMFYQHIYFLLM